MHKRDQCRRCWPGVSDIRHRSGTGFPEYSTKWEEDITPFDHTLYLLSLDQFSSVTQSCPTLCDPMNRSTPGLPVHHQLPESPQTHVHGVSDTISSSVVSFSSCPQSLLASGSFQITQFFSSGGQSIRVSASTLVLPMNTQDWSPLGWTSWNSLQSKDSQESG